MQRQYRQKRRRGGGLSDSEGGDGTVLPVVVAIKARTAAALTETVVVAGALHTILPSVPTIQVTLNYRR